MELKRTVELTATFSNRRTVRDVARTGVFSAEGRYIAGFWLQDTGCETVVLSARVTGQAVTAPVIATLAFHCGE